MSSEALERAQQLVELVRMMETRDMLALNREGQRELIATLDALLAEVARLEQELATVERVSQRNANAHMAAHRELAVAREREQRALKLCERPIFEVEQQGLHVAATGNAYGLAKAVRAALVDESAATLAEPEGTGEETNGGTVDPGVATLSGSASAAADEPCTRCGATPETGQTEGCPECEGIVAAADEPGETPA